VVLSRVGLDLEPIDLGDAAAMRWLQALIWPEATGSRELLTGAIALAQQDLPPLVAGDALDTLSATLASLSAEATTVVYHAHTLYQFTPAAQARFDEQLMQHARSSGRPIWRIGVEVDRPGEPAIVLTHYRPDGHDQRLLARCDAHGAWIEWIDRASS
jgi:hypothetical protein